MRLTFVLSFLCCFALKGQAPKNALALLGPGQSVNFQEVLQGVKTIEFWILLSEEVDNTNPIERPILVRDNTTPQQFGTGEFGLYFGKTGTPEAGHLVFMCGSETTANSIKSDSDTWQKDVWFHVAAVLHPQNGMELYINGIKQQATNQFTGPIYFRNEGPTGNLQMGKWGTISNYGIHALFDELRFYSTAKSETEIRAGMCKKESLVNAQLKAYFTFDYDSPQGISSSVNNHAGIPTNLTTGQFVPSWAPVGDKSSFVYAANGLPSLEHQEQVKFTVSAINSPADGVHIYSTADPDLSTPGLFNSFFGVWFSSPNASYTAEVDFSTLSPNCDSCNGIDSRDIQTQNWNPRTAYSQNCKFTFANESPGQLDFREEYAVRYFLELKSALPDTITECEGSYAYMSAAPYIGAKYYWENGDTNRQRKVDTTGYYWVNIKWHGCEITDTTFVEFKPTPYFELPNDTAICIGDTLILHAPNIDSATFDWGNGSAYGSTYSMYQQGTMTLLVTLDNCTYYDEIYVELIKSFPVNLGPDTTLCLGQSYTVSAPPDVNFIWSTGQTSRSITVFNTHTKIWLEAWNSCFYKTDTVEIAYEECDCHIYMANSFTPNNDGTNDFFTPVTGCYFQEFELMIFNRWGEKVFQSNSVNSPWDGTKNGRQLPEGVYTYQMRHKKYTDNKISSYQRGQIHLIR